MRGHDRCPARLIERAVALVLTGLPPACWLQRDCRGPRA